MPTTDNDEVPAWRWNVLPPRMPIIDISVPAASGHVRDNPQGKKGDYVPFVNRPFESKIHGTVNFTQFCCVLLVTWCYRVLLSCYLRPK